MRSLSTRLAHALLIWLVGTVGVGLTGCGGKRVPIVTAAYEGDLQQVQVLVQSGANVNEEGAVGDGIVSGSPSTSAIGAAAKQGHADVVTFLLKHRASPGIAMLLATMEGHPDVIRALLDGGVPVDDTALLLSASSNKPTVLKAFLEKGANINGVYRSGTATLLVEALNGKASDCVKLLIESGANPNQPGRVASTRYEDKKVHRTDNTGTYTSTVYGVPNTTFRQVKPIDLAWNDEIRRLLLAAGAKP